MFRHLARPNVDVQQRFQIVCSAVVELGQGAFNHVGDLCETQSAIQKSRHGHLVRRIENRRRGTTCRDRLERQAQVFERLPRLPTRKARE